MGITGCKPHQEGLVLWTFTKAGYPIFFATGNFSGWSMGKGDLGVGAHVPFTSGGHQGNRGLQKVEKARRNLSAFRNEKEQPQRLVISVAVTDDDRTAVRSKVKDYLLPF